MLINVPQNVQRRQTTMKYAFLISGFIILAIVYYYRFCGFHRTSDDANALLAGSEMANGNWRLKGWLLPDDNFLTSAVPLYAMLGKCVGFSPLLMFWLPAMLWAGVASLSLVLAQNGRIRTEKWVAMAAVATPVLLPIIRNNGAMSQITHDLHTGTILYVLLCFLLVKKALSRSRERSRAILVAYTLVMFLATFGDTFAIFIGAMPVIVVAAYSALSSSKPRLNALVVVLTILAVVIAKLSVNLNSLTGGLKILHLPMKFAPFDEFGRNIVWAIQYFFMLFGCDFFGKDLFAVSINGPVLALIRLPFLALLIAGFVLAARKAFKRPEASTWRWPISESDYLDALLTVAVIIEILAAVSSTQMVNATSIRYFFPVLVFGAILIARMQTTKPWLRAYFYIALLASLAFSLSAYAQNPRETVLMPKELDAVSNWLSNNNLNDGFGPYWSSSIITAATQNRIKVRALVAASGGSVKPWEWAADKKWFRDGAISRLKPFFVLTHEGEEKFYCEADVIRTLGEPRIKHDMGGYIINIYDPTSDRLRLLSLRSIPSKITLRPDEQHPIPMADFYSQIGSYSTAGWLAGKNTGYPGYLIFGPYWPIDRGTYQVVVSMIASGEISGSSLDVVAEQATEAIASTQLVGGTPEDRPFNVTLNAVLKDSVTDLQIRVYYGGKGTLMVTNVIIRKDKTLAHH
jgi:hypothetical protein